MAFALVLLAIGSVVAGFVGVPHVLGGHNVIHGFLEPSFHVSRGAAEGAPAAAVGEPEAAAEPSPAGEAELMGVSVLVAVAGIGVATLLFLRRRQLADALALRFARLHRVLSNKYYVDEIYDGAVVQPVKILSREGLWKIVDARIIDGAVNGAGETISGAASLVRRVQTGSVRTYAASIFFGVVLILAFYLWR